MVIFANIPLPYNKIWSDAFNIYKKTFSQIWYLAILLGICVSISSALSHAFKTPDGSFSLLRGVLISFSFLTAIYFTNLLLHRIQSIDLQPTVSVKQSALIVLHKFPKLFFALSIVTLLTVLGITLFIIPGIFLTIMLLFTAPLILFDNRGIISGLTDSCVLVWKYWFRTFGIILPVILLNFVINFFINMFNAPSIAVAFVISVAIGTFYFPFFYSILLVQFNDLKIRRAVVEAK